MSQSPEDETKTQESSGQSSESSTEQQQPSQPSKKPAATNEQSQTHPPSVASTPTARPQIGRPVTGRPIIGKPIGTPVQQPRQQEAKQTAAQATPPSTSATPAAPKVSVGTSVQRPTVGTPVSSSSARPMDSAPRPGVAQPAGPGRPVLPPKERQPTKQEMTRRNFLTLLAVVGGLIALGQFGVMGPYLTGSVGSQTRPKQQIFDSQTGAPLSTTNPGPNDWKAFVWPSTGNTNVDEDTFSQCVLIHLPKGYVAPDNLAYKDPASGDYFVAFSRVCVHLWCLYSYVPNDKRMECPCHGSQYVPGGMPGSLGSSQPGIAVAGPASLQTPPNNQLPIITLTTDAQGNFSATGLVGQIGCGQKC